METALKKILILLLSCLSLSAAVERLHWGEKYNLYCIGDSLMVGLSSATNMPALFTNSDAVPRFMARMTNAGSSGDFATNMVTRATTGMTPFKAGDGTNFIAFIEGGTNDKGTSGTDMYPTNTIFSALTNLWWMATTNGVTQLVRYTLLPRTAWTAGSAQAMSWTNLNLMIVAASNTYPNSLLVPWHTMFTTNDLSDGTHLFEYGQEITANFITTNLMPTAGSFQGTAGYTEVRR